MISLKKIVASIFLLSVGSIAIASDRDILVEFKGSIFVPSNENFDNNFGNCGDFGLELTGNMFDRLYAFASADFIVKDGSTVELTSFTKINIVNLGLGVKYFVPFNHGDFYVGLGIEPTYVGIKNQIPHLLEQQSWICGGIAKAGLIIDLPCSLFLDFFIDYSFAKANFYNSTPVQMTTTYLNGALFGIGLGYRFN
jgi:outer membrane protein W